VRRHTNGLYVDTLVSGLLDNAQRTQYAELLEYYVGGSQETSRYIQIRNARSGLAIPVAEYRSPGSSLFTLSTPAPPPHTVLPDGRIVQTLMLYAPGLAQSLGTEDGVDVRFTEVLFQGRAAELFASDTDWHTLPVSEIGPA